MCSVLAARMMVRNKTGLIVNVSSPAGLGGAIAFHNIPYGVGKEAVKKIYFNNRSNYDFLSVRKLRSEMCLETQVRLVFCIRKDCVIITSSDR